MNDLPLVLFVADCAEARVEAVPVVVAPLSVDINRSRNPAERCANERWIKLFVACDEPRSSTEEYAMVAKPADPAGTTMVRKSEEALSAILW